MAEQPPFNLPQAHHWFATELNNRAWDLFERASRTQDEDDEMIRAAQAALYHWSQIGTELNLLRAEVLCAHVYAAVSRSEPTRFHAERARRLAEGLPNLEPFDAATVETARAHAFQLGKDVRAANIAIRRALAIAESFNQADREVLYRLCPRLSASETLYDVLGSIPKSDDIDFTRDASLVIPVDLPGD